MKDMLGKEIKKGDTLVYTSDCVGPGLTIGVVRDVDCNSAVIARTFTGRSYCGIHDGVQYTEKYNADTKTMQFHERTPCLVTIGIESRCLVLDVDVIG